MLYKLSVYSNIFANMKTKKVVQTFKFVYFSFEHIRFNVMFLIKKTSLK